MNPLSDNHPWTSTEFQRQVYIQTMMESGARRLESNMFDAKYHWEQRDLTLTEIVVPHLQALAQREVEEKGTAYNQAINNLIRFYFPTTYTRKFIKRHLASLRRQEAARPSSPNEEDVAVTVWNTPPASPDAELHAEFEAVTNPFWGAETLYQWVMEE
ncbi:hypothetical protein [Absidia glauca]|uniref:Uncharacterized protein n=1 Tax=Absidia glauca TaxID=4829 RepID=A0A168S8T0_ABSGL|nr:hypothetical protein [Absidia glauca]